MLAKKEQDQRRSGDVLGTGVRSQQVQIQADLPLMSYLTTLEGSRDQARRIHDQDRALDKSKGEDPESERAYWIGYWAGHSCAMQHAIDLLHTSIIHDERLDENRELVSQPDGGINSHVEHSG